MKLNEIGEFGFIERFKPLFNNLIQNGVTGIGDDCAIIPANEEEDWLVTTDLLMEDVHFLRNAITPQQLGYKSLAVNLSDIASMGGTPIGSFMSIAIPSDLEVEYLDGFIEGYQEISSKYSTPLLGGDTTKSLKHLAINVCVIGKCPKGKARLRSMAQTGDIVCVTGNLGDSAGGLQVLLHQFERNTEAEYLIKKHHLPEPRLKEGQFLASQEGVRAMMDISDGISSDLRHILKASKTSAQIQLHTLPLSEQLRSVAMQNKLNAAELAVSGGEDYELLITIDSTQLSDIQEKFQHNFGKRLYPIGTITDGTEGIKWVHFDQEVTLSKGGFNHFQ